MFWKHIPQLSKIFWENLDYFVEILQELLNSLIRARYTAEKAPYLLADKVKVGDSEKIYKIYW